MNPLLGLSVLEKLGLDAAVSNADQHFHQYHGAPLPNAFRNTLEVTTLWCLREINRLVQIGYTLGYIRNSVALIREVAAVAYYKTPNYNFNPNDHQINHFFDFALNQDQNLFIQYVGFLLDYLLHDDMPPLLN